MQVRRKRLLKKWVGELQRKRASLYYLCQIHGLGSEHLKNDSHGWMGYSWVRRIATPNNTNSPLLWKKAYGEVQHKCVERYTREIQKVVGRLKERAMWEGIYHMCYHSLLQLDPVRLLFTVNQSHLFLDPSHMNYLGRLRQMGWNSPCCSWKQISHRLQRGQIFISHQRTLGPSS